MSWVLEEGWGFVVNVRGSGCPVRGPGTIP